MAKIQKSKVFDAAEAAQEIKPVIAPDQFKIDGKTYTYAMPKINISGIGIRTALECILDKEVYAELGGMTINAYLVSIGSGAVKEI